MRYPLSYLFTVTAVVSVEHYDGSVEQSTRSMDLDDRVGTLIIGAKVHYIMRSLFSKSMIRTWLTK